jgi:hypothetical protein
MRSTRNLAGQHGEVTAMSEVKPNFRTKTVSTRLTAEELAEIEAAAECSGQALAEWLRESALQTARRSPAEPLELLLAEVWALRYVLLNLFHAGAEAAAEGKQMHLDSIVKIRDHADARKLQQARKLLEEFLSSHAKRGGERP